MSETYEIRDVPESDLETQMNILRQDGAESVSSTKQENGMFTITAVYSNS